MNEPNRPYEMCPQCSHLTAIAVPCSEELVVCDACKYFDVNLDFIEFTNREDYLEDPDVDGIYVLEDGSNWSIKLIGPSGSFVEIVYIIIGLCLTTIGSGLALAVFKSFSSNPTTLDLTVIMISLIAGALLYLAFCIFRHLYATYFGYTRITVYGNRIETFTGKKSVGVREGSQYDRIVNVVLEPAGSERWDSLKIQTVDPFTDSKHEMRMLNNSMYRDDHLKYVLEFLLKKTS